MVYPIITASANNLTNLLDNLKKDKENNNINKKNSSIY
jgi:hypothetical protein